LPPRPPSSAASGGAGPSTPGGSGHVLNGRPSIEQQKHIQLDMQVQQQKKLQQYQLQHAVAKQQQQQAQRVAAPIVDVSKLNVEGVFNYMARFVCKGHDKDTVNEFVPRISLGVRKYRLTGRALLAHEPSPQDLARAILLQKRTADFDVSDPHCDRDVLFYSVQDFIKRARERASASVSLF
jgi:hypothetical protein